MLQKIKTLQLIHLAICLGMVAAYFFASDISIATFKVPNIGSEQLIYVGIPILAVFLSNFIFRSQLKQADPKMGLENNLSIYQTASIIRWAILEGAAFIILFAVPNLIVFGLLLILYLVILRPTKEKIERDLEISL